MSITETTTSRGQRPTGVPVRAKIIDHDALNGTPAGWSGRWWTWRPRAGEAAPAGAVVTLYQGERRVEWGTTDEGWTCPSMANGFHYLAEARGAGTAALPEQVYGDKVILG